MSPHRRVPWRLLPLLLALLPAVGLAAPPAAAPPCPAAFQDAPIDGRGATELRCTCAAAPPRPVWGSGIYTADSSVCAAARHAGAIPPTGGPLRARPAPGCPRYLGTTAHGVSTHAWGPYGASFYFPGHGDGTCPAVPQDLCPPTFEAVAEPPAQCRCAGDETGAIYGTGTYTTDSALCVAARHAGVLGPDGGLVYPEPRPGCHRYDASERHGIRSLGWNTYGRSFTFRPPAGRQADYPTDCPAI